MSKIKEQREAAGMTRVELARESGVPLRTLEEWEAGRRLPRDVYQLAKVARALNCAIEDLIIIE